MLNSLPSITPQSTSVLSNMKNFVLYLIVALMTSSVVIYAKSDSTTTATVWQGQMTWQSNSAPTQIYIVMKTDSSVSIYSTVGGRVGKENGSWRNTANGVELAITKSSVIYSATNNGQALSGTVTNTVNNTSGTWNCTLMQGTTEQQLTQQLLQTSEQR